MARYTRHGTSATPACPAAKAVSLPPYAGLGGARSYRQAYGDVSTLAFSPLGSLSAFQQADLAGQQRSTTPCPRYTARPWLSVRPSGRWRRRCDLRLFTCSVTLTKSQLEWFLCMPRSPG